MKNYLLGDLHGIIDFHHIYRDGHHCDDRLIQLGDFGVIFRVYDNDDQERMMLNDLEEYWGEVLFVDGNHENFQRLYSYPLVQKYGGWVRQIRNNIFWLQRGEVYNIDGKTFWVMGGGDSIDKLSRVEGYSWWPEEQPNYLELENGMKNLDKVDWKVDYVLTHTCPMSTKIEITTKMRLVPNSDHLENYLEEIKKKLTFVKWYFGHFHIDVHFDRFNCLYYELLILGDDIDPGDDDFISGMYAPPLVDVESQFDRNGNFLLPGDK